MKMLCTVMVFSGLRPADAGPGRTGGQKIKKARRTGGLSDAVCSTLLIMISQAAAARIGASNSPGLT